MLAILALSMGVPWHEWLHSPASPSVVPLSLDGFCFTLLTSQTQRSYFNLNFPARLLQFLTTHAEGLGETQRSRSCGRSPAQPFHHPLVPPCSEKGSCISEHFYSSCSPHDRSIWLGCIYSYLYLGQIFHGSIKHIQIKCKL